MGGKTQTSTSTVQIPPEVLARYNAVNARAENVAATPFQAYSSDPNAFVAPMTGTQRGAIGLIGNAATSAQPWFGAAGAATTAGMGPANLGELDVNKYMSPYLSNVVQSTSDLMRQNFGQQISGALGSAIQSGAGWGDRSGIAAANLAQQQQLAYGKTMSDILNQGYQGALGTAQQQQSAKLAADQANLARLLQGGQSLGQLGAGAQGAALAGGQALLGAGTQEQQTQQAGLSALYNQFLQERAYPFQVAQFLGNIAMGTGALSGATTTETKPAGFFSGFKDGGKVIEGSYRRGGLVPESMGGHVMPEHMGEGYADGGAPMDYSTMVMQQLFGGTDPTAGAYGMGKIGLGAGSYVPQANLPVGQLSPPKISEAAKQTGISDLVNVAEKGSELWDKYSPKADTTPFNVNDRKESVTDALYSARGGAIRPGLAAGGLPYDPQNTGYVPDNTPQEAPKLKAPGISDDNSQSGLSKVADMAKIAMMFMPMNRGGVTGYAGGGAADNAYEVQKGDTLWDIAKKHGMSLDDLIKANADIEDPNRISIGQRINLPQMQQVEPVVPLSRNMRPGLVPPATGDVSSFAPKQASTVLSPDYQFPTGGFGQERYPGSYMSDRNQKNLSNLLQLKAMGLRPEAQDAGVYLGSNYGSDYNPGFAAGGVVGRNGYLDGGFASDTALAELARKKKEQDILNELGSSDWSGGLGGNQPAPAAIAEPAGLAAGQAALKATGETAPSPLTYSAPEQTGIQKIGQGLLRTQNPTRANETIQSEIVRRGLPGAGGFMSDVGDWLTKTPSQISAEAPQRTQTSDMMNWYRDNSAYLASNPAALQAAKADPVAYYQTHSGFAGGLIPAGGGYTPGEAVRSQTISDAPSAIAKPDTGSVGVSAPSSDSLYLGASAAGTAPQPGLVPPIPRGREERPNIAPEEKRGLVPTAAGTYELGPTREKYTGDDFFGEYIIPRESAGRQFDKNGNPLTSSAGAIGISQMLPSTGPEAAKLAGVEWDENLFYNDPAYNEKLGRAYFNNLLKRYNGDTTLASAAYNAGSGNVDKAIARARENGGNWTDYLPSETQKYISGMPGGAAEPGSVSGGGGGDGGGLGGGNFFDQMIKQAGGAENIVLPFLAGLGKMAGSQSRFLGTALLEGIGGGAEAYMNRQTQLADINQKKAMALNYLSSAMAGMLINDGKGNMFVPLQGGGYQPLFTYINDPNRQPTIFGSTVDRILADIGKGDFSSMGLIENFAKQAQQGVTPTQMEAPANILWDENAERALQNSKQSFGSNILTGGNLESSGVLLRDAISAADNAGETKLTMLPQAGVLVDAIASKNSGRLNSFVNENVYGPLASILGQLGIEFPWGEDRTAQMDILNKNAAAIAQKAAAIGDQRAAAALDVFLRMTPGVDLPPEANAEIMATLLQSTQTAIDKANFYSYWQARNNGLLTGAESAFRQIYGDRLQQEHAQLKKFFQMAETDGRISQIMNAIKNGDVNGQPASFADVQEMLREVLGPNISPALARIIMAGA